MKNSAGERTRLLHGSTRETAPSSRGRVRTSSATPGPPIDHTDRGIRFVQQRHDSSFWRQPRFIGICATLVFALGLISAISSKSAERDALAAEAASRASAAVAISHSTPPAEAGKFVSGHALVADATGADGKKRNTFSADRGSGKVEPLSRGDVGAMWQGADEGASDIGGSGEFS